MAAIESDEMERSGDNRVITFPLAGRGGLIRRCAIALDSKHGEEAVTYWRGECQALGAELLALGCCEADMRQQIMAFQAEVQAELMYLHAPEQAARK